MRVLFIHAMRESATEYNIHKLIADNADPEKVESHFIWQTNKLAKTEYRAPVSPGHVHHYGYDFGRNMSIKPQPSKVNRAVMTLGRLPGALSFLAHKINRIKPDVIYTSQQRYDVQIARLAHIFFRIPQIIHIHYPVGSWLGNNTVKIIRKTSNLITVSDFVMQSALDMKVSSKHIFTLPNPIDISVFNQTYNRKSVRSIFNLPFDTPIILSVGRLDPSKGHLELIKAFKKVNEIISAAKLIICGSTTTQDNYDEFLKQQAFDLGLGNNVIFAGQREDISTFFAGADIFCLPTINEAFGLVFLEAMAAGVPIVACRSGGVHEIIQDQVNGLLSEPGDIQKLSANLLRLLENKQLAEEIVIKGKQTVSTKYTPTNVSSLWVNILSDLSHSA